MSTIATDEKPNQEPDAADLAVDGSRGGRGVPEPAQPARRRRRFARRPVKRSTIVLHRWLSLILGLVLLVITTSGAAVVYESEWTKWTNSGAFHVTSSEHPVTFQQAIGAVARAHPTFDPGSVNVYSGLYEVYSADEEAHPGFYGVDPGTGRITGYVNPDSGVMAFMAQIHECFFTCDDYPGYIPWLAKPMPTLGMHWLEDVTRAGFVLGVFGVLLLFLAVSGIWLWWPGIKRLKHGFRVRTKKGRYARDYDLHQVIGMIALPFLLVWGLTGASFEFHWVNTAWYALTGGEQEKDPPVFASHKASKATPDLDLNAAAAAAQRKAGDGRLVYASLPAKGDATAYYDFWFSKDFDQYAHGPYPGQLEVEVDRHDPSHVQVNDYGTAPTVSNHLLDTYGYGVAHAGIAFNGWWRILWFVFGLTPLALAVTGVSTWLAKRSVRKRRKRARSVRAAAQAAAAVDGESVADGNSVADEDDASPAAVSS